jgi:hypothetical protein
MKAMFTRHIPRPLLCAYVLLIRRAQRPLTRSQFLNDRGQVLFWATLAVAVLVQADCPPQMCAVFRTLPATFNDRSKGLFLSDRRRLI